ncbi:MAG: hypothetical protein LW855_01800 [Alphaproteobacteria bacterium]|nr:hypothetical protein [Alphaproteobacteria bacterium]
MSRESLSLVFQGSAVQMGDIDIENLAPALLSLSNLIQKSNEAINGDRASVSVRVQASSPGSFQVSLDVIQTLTETARNFLDFAVHDKEKIAAANELVELIFKCVGGGVAFSGGLFALIKALKGKKPDSIEEKGDIVTIKQQSNIFITNKRTIILAENGLVREAARKTLQVLSNNGFDSLSMQIKSGEKLVISKEELSYFDIPDREEILEDKQRSMTLQIISLSFKEDNKWRVTDGLEPFSVTIEDSDFLKKIANDEISFSKNDYLVCDVHERQFQTDKGLRMERAIIRVTEHRPGFKQLKLL